ncbi:MAG: ABC transporter permease [Candidatus Methanoperedenaceae archaeon]|nr:MAG: ABC transporter permease [Candidatus Methanoperedenaceae archaeon]
MYFLDYKELIKNLVISDLKTKYSSSILGFAWSMLNPLLMMLVLYFVFSNVFKSTQEHFALYLLIGITAWRFFAMGTSMAMSSIVGKASLVTKIFIPREILTLSVVLSALVSSLLEFLVLIPLLFIFGVTPSLMILLFPLLHILYFPIVYGIALALASLYVYYRDMNQIWDVLIQIGFFLSPIVYPLSLIPENYRFYYMLNPITRLIEMYRDVLLYNKLPELMDLGIVILYGIVLLILGSLLFRKLSSRFAEEI